VIRHLDRSNSAPVVLARRLRQGAIERLDEILGEFMLKLVANLSDAGHFAWTRHLPTRPRWLSRWAEPPVWAESPIELPPLLRSYAGVQRDPEAERQAFEQRPLHIFNRVHKEASAWTFRHSWSWLLAPYPGLRRAVSAVARVRLTPPAGSPVPMSAAAVSALIRAEARRLGISSVGFAAADPKYAFAESEGAGHPTVIICAVEQDWQATQTAPSARSERGAFRAYGQVFSRAAGLAEYVKTLGYEAHVGEFGGGGIVIHFGVEAGLGQLGLNGQLLTPAAGSRLRLALITTTAPVQLGEPVDFGIPRICDECQICVRRCPPGAIPKTRAPKRGIVKAAIKPERCYPILAQAHGCAICMKVCPIQRYGLEPVITHFKRTGEILGKGTDELEGYAWPLDGRYYGAGRKPPISSELVHPPGWHFDKDRTEPIGVDD